MTAPAAAQTIPEYGHVFSGPGGAFAWLEEPVAAFLAECSGPLRILDVGCGNGYWASRLEGSQHRVVGIDASGDRIENARREVPGARFEQMEIGPGLLDALGEEPFDLVVSTEVVEHLFLPRVWAEACFAALRPGGRLVCSTPYHGYLKNLMIAASGHWDRHHHTLRAVGHIKFFSRATLTKLLADAGFSQIRFRGGGRLPYLWKSMVLAGERPA